MDTADKTAQAALRHYEALKKAQAAYYDRKHPAETRRPRGRPKKVVAEGGGGGGEQPFTNNSSI